MFENRRWLNTVQVFTTIYDDKPTTATNTTHVVIRYSIKYYRSCNNINDTTLLNSFSRLISKLYCHIMPAFVRKMHSIRFRLGFCPVPAERSQVKHSMNVRTVKEAKFSTGRKRRHGGRFEADPTKLAQIHHYDGLNPTLTPIFFYTRDLYAPTDQLQLPHSVRWLNRQRILWVPPPTKGCRPLNQIFAAPLFPCESLTYSYQI